MRIELFEVVPKLLFNVVSSKLFNAQVKLKPYTNTELSELYEVNKDTLKKWIKPSRREINKKHREFYTVRQVGVIIKRLDFPHYNEVA